MPMTHKQQGGREVRQAAKEGNLSELSRLVLTNSTPVDGTDGQRRTALHYAAERGHIDVIRFLVEHGGDVEARDVSGETPLILAADKGHTDVCTVLLDLGSVVDHQNIWGISALMRAAMFGHVDTVRLLMGRGANVELQNKNQRRAVDMAKEETIRLILAEAHPLVPSDSVLPREDEKKRKKQEEESPEREGKTRKEASDT